MSNPNWSDMSLAYPMLDYGTGKTVKPRVASSKFGDGYEQRAAVGLNNKPQMWDVQLTDRPIADIDTIEAFLEAQGGVDYFYWIPPRQSTAIKALVRTWKATEPRALFRSISFTIEQVFDL